MLNLLLIATPLAGHVDPMARIGEALVQRGHRATLLTGRDFEHVARSHDVGFTPLPSDADFRLRAPRTSRGSRVSQGRDQILETFVRPLTAQHLALRSLIEADDWDVVICDTAFLGALPSLLNRPLGRRIPFVGVSVTPLALTSADCAPFGSALQPGTSRWTRLRNGQIQWLLSHGPLRPLHQEMGEVLAQHGIPPDAVDYFDVAGLFDVTCHLAPPEFEYPRRGIPPTVRCVGPLEPERNPAGLPAWWDDMHSSVPVVHVTQGTVDNGDLSKLIVPTIRALAGENVLTTVSTGGQPLAALLTALGDRLPGNVRVAPFLPYDRLLPRVAAVVTNGGFGGVLQALRHAVPLVVAGDTEDKPEVAARVSWSGAGIDLRTGRPSVLRLRTAVRTVLSDPGYRAAAVRMSSSITRLGDPRDALVHAVEEVSAQVTRR